jgi:hypothetical protein
MTNNATNQESQLQIIRQRLVTRFMTASEDDIDLLTRALKKGILSLADNLNIDGNQNKFLDGFHPMWDLLQLLEEKE